MSAYDYINPQPGQHDSFHPKFHPLPGEWARQQLEGKTKPIDREHKSKPRTELQRALEAEQRQHTYWEEYQGVKPGVATYEDPRQVQNTLLPSAKYGTEGRGYG